MDREKLSEDLNKIRESLIEQANRKGANVAFITDQIDTYIRYTELERDALEDIKNNGTTIKMTSSVGKVSERVNPSIKTALMYSKQKLDILKRLNLSLDTITGDNTEDSDI